MRVWKQEVDVLTLEESSIRPAVDRVRKENEDVDWGLSHIEGLVWNLAFSLRL